MGISSSIVAKNTIVPDSFYSIVEKDSVGNNVSFEKFRGKVVYGVNVASNCGSTKAGYDLVVSVLELRDRGVEVALFPCNQFLWQEPGNDKQIENFCIARGAKSANLFCKGDVNGDNTRPTYRFLKAQGVVDKVAWNFQGKFLVDKEGNDPTTLSQQIIELLLK